MGVGQMCGRGGAAKPGISSIWHRLAARHPFHQSHLINRGRYADAAGRQSQSVLEQEAAQTEVQVPPRVPCVGRLREAVGVCRMETNMTPVYAVERCPSRLLFQMLRNNQEPLGSPLRTRRGGRARRSSSKRPKSRCPPRCRAIPYRGTSLIRNAPHL